MNYRLAWGARVITHRATAEEDDEESHANSSDANYPRETEEENHTENVLNGGKVDSHDCSKVSFLFLLCLASLAAGHVG